MKIAFFGTPDFAGEILSGILEFSGIGYPQGAPLQKPRRGAPCGYPLEVALVVSQPDKAAGRKKEFLPTPVKRVALDAGIEVMQPKRLQLSPNPLQEREQLHPSLGEGIEGEEFIQYLKNLNLDFIVVVAYGKIIPQEILDIPKYGCINIHGSILPKYRGASPVQAAVKAGDKQTGLTTMYMSAGMDEGDILKIAKVDIDNVDTSQDIFKKFVQIGPELLIQTLREIISGDLTGVEQDHEVSSHCGKISREDGEVFFQKQSSEEIYNTYRAYTPWPGIFSFYEGRRFVLEEVGYPQGAPLQDNVGVSLVGTPGQFIKLSKNCYGIVCADKKVLEITRVKLEGKTSMDIASFVNGNREVVGYKFS